MTPSRARRSARRAGVRPPPGDVFDEEGRFLGDAELPEGTQMFPPPYVRGDLFLAAYLAAYMDEVGTVMVKRYRIVLPG